MGTRWSPLLAVVMLLPSLVRAQAAQTSDEIALAGDMAEGARRFLSSLSPEQRKRAVFPVGSDERLRWQFVPNRSRRGLTLGELDDAQRHLAYGFLATALSRPGFLKASTIMALDEVLRRRSGDTSGFRDPRAYFLTIFGEPSPAATWGFRIEGHHLSLNLTLVDGVHPVAAPAFFGANPAHVDGKDGKGLLAGTRVLGREEELGFRLLASLDEEQRRTATFQASAPAEILTGPGAELKPLPGLAAARMTPGQRKILTAIVDEAAGNLPRELADRERARVTENGLDKLVFTWAGGGQPGKPHYYRVAGPTFLYELDNTQDGANHIHTVWHARDEADGDFGVDLLRRHYREEPHGQESPPIRSEWARAVPPFHLVGNIYYVGGQDIASYLIATSDGLILLDVGPREMEPVVRAGIVGLGFRLEDVKILLVSHAHWDHVEGLAAMKKLTGAKLFALQAEVPALTSGKDLSALGETGWEPVAVDRVLHDGDDVVLGDVTVRALWTPGHTQGTASYTTTAREHGRSYQVVFVGSPAANAGVKLIGNPRHPTIADDLARAYRVLRSLKPDIWLTGHPADILAGKMERLRAGEPGSLLVDPAGYVKMLDEAEADTRKRLDAERQGR